MDYYHKFAAICCLLAVLNVYGTDGLVTQWTGLTVAKAGDTVISTALSSTDTVGGSAPGTAGITFRDGLTSADGTLLTVAATVDGSATYTLDATSLNTFAISGAIITVKASVTLSYAVKSTYTVSVTVVDDNEDDTSVLTLTVTVNGMPTFSATPICLNIADATALGTTLYTYTIADPVDATTVTTTITSGDDDSYFTTPVVAGELITEKAMAKATVEVFMLTIQAVDAGSPPSTAITTFAVLVYDSGTGTGTTCSCSSGATVVIGSVMTTMALLVTYFL